MDLKSKIRDIPDFPKTGIMFRDITTLLADADALHTAIDRLANPYRDQRIDLVAGIESRGFIFGTAVADRLGAGFVPIRKPGKLPAETIAAEYTLEYGTDSVEMHVDAIAPGQRILLIDDLIATGGTMKAACQLVEQVGGVVAGIALLIELTGLKGRDALGAYDVYSVMAY